MGARSLSISGAVLMVLAGASCAKGTPFTGIGGSGAEGGSASTSSGSGSSSTSTSTSTSSASSTSTTSSSSSTTASSSSSSGMTCPDPCKLTTPQCGCGAGEACTVASYAVVCGAAGSDATNQACGTSASDLCAPGAVCVGASSVSGQCLKFCDSDADCSAFGGVCEVTLSSGPGSTTSIPGVTLCAPNCDPLHATGCPSGAACGLGLNQTDGVWFGVCGPSGTKSQGAACTVTAPDCSPGYTCIDPGTGPSCLKFCNALVGTCPGGMTCIALQGPSMEQIIIGGVEYGVCF